MASATKVGSVNPDLAKEREKATFNAENLTNFIYRGEQIVRRKRHIQNLVLQDPFYKTCKPWAFCSREEQYEEGLKKHTYINKRMKELGLTDPLEMYMYRECAAAHENSPIGLHSSMFLPTIEKQGTEEQKKKWLPPARRLEIIGTYAQTEMGHGTFLRGIETEARYDPKTQEFVLNSPTITSMKFWPGNLGKTVNYCVLMAQLYTNGKCHGMHSFMVQLRSLKDHTSLPGIELGDIGPKLGYGTNDNGYLRLHNVRIPRENMLMRYAKVLEDGTYVPPTNARLAYGTMMLIRSMLVTDAARSLSQSCIIAIRYSAVRRQTEVRPGGEELQILDYQTQQHKLFPLLAMSYAMYFTGRKMFDIYLSVSAQIEQGNLEMLPELHALSAGLKAFSTWDCTAGIEVCRMACGGHGYSHASGIPKIYQDATPGCTYEGENTVMMLQTARYLVKMAEKAAQGEKLTGFMSYLNQDLNKKSCLGEEVALNCLVMAYEHRAARMVGVAATKLQRLVASGKPREEAWNMSSVQLTWASRAVCHAYVVKSFVEVLTEADLDPATRRVLTALCKLYGVCGIINYLGEFMQDGFFNSVQVDIINKKMISLLAELRNDAVALVDAFDYPDHVLDSCLGRYDGNVYEALYEYAKSSPLNDTDVHKSYYKYLQPLIRQGLDKLQLPARL